MNCDLSRAQRATGPFDDSAIARQKRMGLLAEDGRPDEDAISVMSRIYAGLFYDDLCDASDGYDHVVAVCDSLIDMLPGSNSKRVLVAVCTEYDGMLRPIPEPVWWIAGNAALVTPFVEGFVSRLREFREESEVS